MEIVKIISVVCGLLPFAYIYFCWLFGLNDLLYDFLEKVFFAILSIGLFWKGLAIFINWCASNNYDDDDYYAVELLKGSQVYVPTPQVASTQKAPLEVKEEAKNDNPSESRGTAETIIVVVPEKNGGQFLHVIPNTKEHQEALARKAKAESELKAEINTGAGDMLKSSNLYAKVVNQRVAN